MLWGEPLWGSSPPSGLAALAPPQAANAERWGSSVPPASSLSPMGCPSPSPGSPTGLSLLGPAPRLLGQFSRVVQSGLLPRAPSFLPSSGAAAPLGGLAAKSRNRRWAAPHLAATVAATLPRGSRAAATVTQASWEPPSPTRAPLVLLSLALMALAGSDPPMPPCDEAASVDLPSAACVPPSTVAALSPTSRARLRPSASLASTRSRVASSLCLPVGTLAPRLCLAPSTVGGGPALPPAAPCPRQWRSRSPSPACTGPAAESTQTSPPALGPRCSPASKSPP